MTSALPGIAPPPMCRFWRKREGAREREEAQKRKKERQIDSERE